MPRAASSAMVKAVGARKKKAKPSHASAMRVAAPRLRGHGDYTYDKPGPWGEAGRWIGDALGRSFAGEGGGKLGGKLGSYLHYIGKIFGSGDYVTSTQQVANNTLVNSAQAPQFANSKHAMRIQHREFLGDIYSSATPGQFQIQDYPINPGMQQTFPWLSEVVGSNYQQYRINGMVFEFRSMSADALNSTNTALGSVVMATDYDSTDLRFNSKAQMENTEFGVSCKPSACMIHAIECARSQTSISEQYVRFAAPPANADIRLYDLGRFSIATVGMQAASVNLGELWVSYDITFLKPIQSEPLVDSEYAFYEMDLKANLNTNPVSPDLSASDNFDNIGVTFDSSTNTVILPPTMRPNTVLQCLYYRFGSSTANVVAPSVGTLNHLTAFSRIIPATTATVENSVLVVDLRYDGLGSIGDEPSFVIAPTTGPATPTECWLQISQINYNALPV